MKQLLMLLAAAGVAVGLTAAPALAQKGGKQPGALYVFDDGKFFTPEGSDAAKAVLRGSQFDHGMAMTVDTYAKVPDDKQAALKQKGNDRFFTDWAKELAASDKAKGVYVLICRQPTYLKVIADRETRDRGFAADDEKKLADVFTSALRPAKGGDPAANDRGLKAAAEFLTTDLKDTAVKGGTQKASADAAKGGGMGIGGWVCLGLCVLLGAWLVIGLIRAFTGGGGGGYGPGGMGGGGGGFMTSMFGGLFGAMAGMWMYNSLFGGGGLFGGSDAMAGGGDVGAAGDTGAGDFGGDAGAGGDFGGGGDYGGGGGDFGGGGGDFGGGDFGGGGDF